MTKFLKKFLTGLALSGIVFATPVLAGECEVPKAKFEEQIKAIEGVTVRPLTKEEVKTLLDKKGPPPNAQGSEGLEFDLVVKGEIAAVNVFQNDCFINKIGPTDKQLIYNALGITEG